ncbi:MAG TPA: STAS domain-containing protein [Gammaproteobacteria bacterium]|jgi:phospholipid transport system transporter-binding protein
MSADEPVSVERRDGAVHLNGALTLGNATAALEAVAPVFADGDQRLVFDLSGLWQSDSAALAVLLEWRREALRSGRELEYRGAPERLRQLARISDLEGVLGMDREAGAQD